MRQQGRHLEFQSGKPRAMDGSWKRRFFFYVYKSLEIKFSFSEKTTKIWKNLPLVLIVLSKNCFVKTGGKFFQIFWPSHNIWTLKEHWMKLIFVFFGKGGKRQIDKWVKWREKDEKWSGDEGVWTPNLCCLECYKLHYQMQNQCLYRSGIYAILVRPNPAALQAVTYHKAQLAFLVLIFDPLSFLLLLYSKANFFLVTNFN